jgi:hypothetical protein
MQTTELSNTLTSHNVCSAYQPSLHGDRSGVRAGPCCVQHVEHSLWHTNGLRFVWTAVVRGGSIRPESLLLRVPRGTLDVNFLANPKTDTRFKGLLLQTQVRQGERFECL